jgi:DNA-3-methyladenine glycosylase I
MGFYAKYVLPRLIDIAMRNKDTARLRADSIPPARGEVLEIGIGSGLNLPSYSPEVQRVYGVDPSVELQQMARKRAVDSSVRVRFLSQSAEEALPLINAIIDTEQYHDREWGVPVHDDRKHFEFLVLEAAQAGLSWSIVLKKREGYRSAFSEFDPEKVARYTENRIEKLTLNPAIIRNRMKIKAAVRNARALLTIQEEFGSFDAYCWRFVDGRPKPNRWKAMREIPATSRESDAFSMDLKHRGFSFVGSTVVYAHMQAVGMVNDHLVDCFRYREIRRLDSVIEPADMPARPRNRTAPGP